MEIETFLTHLEAKGLIDGNCHEFLSPGAQVSIPNFYMLNTWISILNQLSRKFLLT